MFTIYSHIINLVGNFDWLLTPHSTIVFVPYYCIGLIIVDCCYIIVILFVIIKVQIALLSILE